MVSLMVTMKPRIREEKGTLRIRVPKMASGAARSMLVASEVNAKSSLEPLCSEFPNGWALRASIVVGASQSGSFNYPA